LRIRITTSGKQGRLTVPFDTSLARFPRNASAEARSSALVAAVDSIGGLGASGFGRTATFAAAGFGATATFAVAGFGATAALVRDATTVAVAVGVGALRSATAFVEDAVLPGTDSFSLPGGADATFAIVVTLLMNCPRSCVHARVIFL
jgi:hypothetical protein